LQRRSGRSAKRGLNSRLTHNRLIRPGLLLRRNGPVAGILAAFRAGAIMDKSGRRSNGMILKTALFYDANSVRSRPVTTPEGAIDLNSVQKRHFLRPDFGS